MSFIDVIIPLPIKQTFTYRVRDAEAAFLRPGMRVVVPFGRNKLRTALVFGVGTDALPEYQTKEIDQILDQQPIVTKTQLSFWQWMAEYYMCTLGEVMKAALPGAMLLESETFIQLLNPEPDQWPELSDAEYLVMEALCTQPRISIDEVRAILSRNSVMGVIYALIDRGLVAAQEQLDDKYKPLVRPFVRLNPELLNETRLNQVLEGLSRAPKQRELLLFLLSKPHEEEIQQAQLLKSSQSNSSVLNSLVDKNFVVIKRRAVDRAPVHEGPTEDLSALSPAQQQALGEIKAYFEQGSICLLHGITSSGKTPLYMHLMQEVLAKQQQVLFIVPEIALTTQLIMRLQRFYGPHVGVYHSRQSSAERVELFQKVKQRDPSVQIVVGARSAIFLPFGDLGLVVLDESHEPSLKQHNPAPRYHGRDAAIMLAHRHGAKVLLGSATPSLESFSNTQQKKFGLVSLNQRYGGVLPPDIELVDLGEQYRKKLMQHHFSAPLIQAIEQVLSRGEQVVLFQNRRGFSALIECLTCGHVPQCPDCDVSLTYHSHQELLRCHYCGHEQGVPHNCMTCGGHELDRIGLGTQQIEQTLTELFPEARLARMDQDTTKGKYAFTRLIERMNQGEIDILVGTQMLAKGLDFDRVSLVGILNADQLMNFPDFRAQERAFQLMSQVSGRAGRRGVQGRVLIQTYSPDHPLLRQVVNGDYTTMYQQQNEQRRQFQYPPYCKLIRVTIKHRELGLCQSAATWLYKVMEQKLGPLVLGPVAPPVSRIRNQYIQQLLIKVPQEQSLSGTKVFLTKVLQRFTLQKEFARVSVSFDVDPIH
jgi:primosomal protein N' (replication factor Y)